ncbi:MAG: hypothetical protein H6708_23705 [Kofleriaceae bacterium]|nr:hypothetical protein [Kofleriaceae bacterium]
MLQLYWGALAFGGTLLLVSLLLGASSQDVDHDAGGGADSDGDAGGDSDADGGAEHGHDGGGAGLDWLPVTSLRFWTFLLAFGGATGVALTYAHAMSWLPVAGASFGVGWLSGVVVVGALRSLRGSSASSELSGKDVRGEAAEVIVAVTRGDLGKIRLTAKGRVVDLIAETEDEAPLPVGTKVMILGESVDGHVQVTRELAS